MKKEENGYYPHNRISDNQAIKTIKKYTQNTWSKLLLAVVGEQFEHSEDLVRWSRDTLFTI
jgi:hypothetical protein